MQKYHINKHLKANYDLILNKAIPNKWDSIGVVFGREGSGKTTFASQGAYYLNKEHISLKNMTFRPEQFVNETNNAVEEESIIWDEAITGANVSAHASEVSQSVVSQITQIRKKKLKIFINFPYLWMLNKYFIARCLFSVYVYAKNFDDRGYFKFYNSNKTEILYTLMKEKYRYNPKRALYVVKPDFEGTFNDFFPFDEKAYDEKKENSRMDRNKEGMNKWKIMAIKLLEVCKENRLMKDAVDKTKFSDAYLYGLIKSNKDYSTNQL